MRRRDVLRFLATLAAVGGLPTGQALAGHWGHKGHSGSSGPSGGQSPKAAGKGGEVVKAPWRAGKQLVVVLLQGGPDGLSMAIPTKDPLYAYLRPTTALAADCGGCDLGDGFLLHPAMAALAPQYAQKKLAVFPACGLPGVPPTHDAALDAFAHGTPQGGGARNGWMARLSAALGGEKGQMLVASQNPVYAGASHYFMISPGHVAQLPALPVEDATLFESVARLYAGKNPLATSFATGRSARQELLAKVLAEARRSAVGALPSPSFPEFGERFGRELAKRRDVALAFLAVGGFDTHSGQGRAKGYLADRLRETAEGLAKMASGLGSAFNDTVIVALGEFGRSAWENVLGGTDNGQGGTMLVLGGPVAGGRLYGDWPGLASHRLAGGRDIPVVTDWRDVVTVLAMRHLGLPDKKVSDIFPGFKPVETPPAILG